jgi:ABC-type oligopeptide transport system substrate-binding subunit
MGVFAAGCNRSDNRYFGKTTPPQKQRLVMAIGAGPGTLDPGLSWDIWEPYAIRALFEGLTGYQPRTLEPIAALATHYEANPDWARFTFYLRGHPSPRGSPLPGGPPVHRSNPALWSDGREITSHDFVYSWRRAVDPANGFPTSLLFYPIRNAQQITSGNAGPEALGVRSLDDFALRVDLREPCPHFLQLVASNQFFPVPRHAVETAGLYWTRPEHMVNSGAFRLRKWRDSEVILVRNPAYYDAGRVRLEEFRLVTIAQPTTAINLYRAGSIDLITPLLPSLHLHVLRRAADFHVHPAIANQYLVVNTSKPPFDSALVRYALNMAIDKKEIERFSGAGAAALALIPPLADYESPLSLPISVRGRTSDVLSFDPRGARSMMTAAGYLERGTLKIEYLYPTQGDHKERFEILQKQLRKYLGIELVAVPKEPSVWNQQAYSLQYRGIAAWADIGLYQDPTYFLDQFLTGASANVTGWTDRRFDTAMAEAKSCREPAVRLQKLADCERMLLEAMPVIPLYFDTWRQLRKPYVRGIERNSMDAIAFHRAWIDTNWR